MNGGDHCFERIRKNGAPLAPSILLLSFSKQEKLSQTYIQSAGMQMDRADEVSFSLRELTFAFIGKALEQCFADDKAEYRVAQKLEAFIVAPGRRDVPVLHAPG